jgi:hypothetical protein
MQNGARSASVWDWIFGTCENGLRTPEPKIFSQEVDPVRREYGETARKLAANLRGTQTEPAVAGNRHQQPSAAVPQMPVQLGRVRRRAEVGKRWRPSGRPAFLIVSLAAVPFSKQRPIDRRAAGMAVRKYVARELRMLLDMATSAAGQIEAALVAFVASFRHARQSH